MKPLLCSVLFLLSLSLCAFELMPLGHHVCLNTRADICSEGTELLYTAEGCGCLAPTDYVAMQICDQITLECREGTGFSFVGNAEDSQQGRRGTLGCGCFSIFDGMIPTSIGNACR